MVTHRAGLLPQTPELASDSLAGAKLKAASGLALLDSRKYKLAARKFVDVAPELAGNYSDVIAAQDVAMYGVSGAAAAARLCLGSCVAACSC
jgi:COP9 signalosome complex subunit 1